MKALRYIHGLRDRRRRRHIEDALKHVYHCETQHISCTIESMAGSLNMNADRTALLLRRLKELSLISMGDKGVELSERGRSYALAVIRTHRLWELYLATETGVRESEWHRRAEVAEHKLSEGDVDQLAKQMCYPRYDPHGAPIPTRDGELPPMEAVPLTCLRPGHCARIVNIEDEPRTIFSQIAALDIYQGMEVRIVENTAEKLVLFTGMEEVMLSPLIADRIYVNTLPGKDMPIISKHTLAELNIGQQGVVTGISRAIRGQQRRRLMDIGVIPGTRITSQMRSPGGDPTAYVIRGATIALRADQARYVYIEHTGSDINENI